MTCYSPSGHCDQNGCDVMGECPWPRKSEFNVPSTPGKHGTEDFWKGTFGDEYASRNTGRVLNNAALFSKIMAHTRDVQSVLELGCGTGENLAALKHIMPRLRLFGVEINESAARKAREHGLVKVTPILEFDPPMVSPPGEEPLPQGTGLPRPMTWDLVFTKGVLIHTPPEDLPAVYERMHGMTKRYLLVCEYFNPTRVEVPYRGHRGKLWKADFAGELLDSFEDLHLVSYGFTWHRDLYPQDDITWFLLERRGT